MADRRVVPEACLDDASLDMGLPPRSSRLYGRSGRAALTAGTLTPVGDNAAREDVHGNVEMRDFDGYDANVMHADEAIGFPGDWITSADGRPFTVPIDSPPLRVAVRDGKAVLTWDELSHEVARQARLRRWQTIR